MASATAERIRAVLPSSWIIVAFAIWLISRVILALYIAIGPLLIGLALFPATRSIFEHWITALFSHCGYSVLGPGTRNARPWSAGATDQPNWKGSAGNDPPIMPFSVVQWIISSAEI